MRADELSIVFGVLSFVVVVWLGSLITRLSHGYQAYRKCPRCLTRPEGVAFCSHCGRKGDRTARPLPKILDVRPPVEGARGITYFPDPQSFLRTWNNVRVYLDGQDITNACFELDMDGGWVGVFKYRMPGAGRPALGEVHEREWRRGNIRLHFSNLVFTPPMRKGRSKATWANADQWAGLRNTETWKL